jgi:hypothetical protein
MSFMDVNRHAIEPAGGVVMKRVHVIRTPIREL